MTEQQELFPVGAPKPPPVTVTATADSELAQLDAQYRAAKAEYDAAEARMKALQTALIVAVAQREPGRPKIDLRIEGQAGALRVAARSRTYVSTDKLRENYPAAFEACKYVTQYWELRGVK
jgi:multidrug efflux pump subunit AcrA (membrane-fusion protein)